MTRASALGATQRKLFVLWLLVAAVCLASCWGGPRSAAQQPRSPTAPRERALQVTFPSGWKLRQESPRKLLLTAPSGCSLLLVVVPAQGEALSQRETLELMQQEEEHYFEQQGGRLELLGKQVWLGRHYIWHELHYRVTCDPRRAHCTDSVCLAFLAPLDTMEQIRARFTCPNSFSLPEEVHAQAVQVVDSVLFGP